MKPDWVIRRFFGKDKRMYYSKTGTGYANFHHVAKEEAERNNKERAKDESRID